MDAAARLTHAYIVAAEPETGLGLARQTAMALLCSGDGTPPCGVCRDCRKVQRGIHPDLITVSRLRDDKGNTKREIYVDQIRTMISDAGLLPNEARRKVYVITDAGTMNANAQNALLKLLEEPPGFDAFILVADSAQELLETVRSRCRLIASGEPGEEGEIPESARAYLAAAAKGDPALVLEALNSLGDAKQQQALEFADGCIRLLTREMGLREPEYGLPRGEMARLVELMEKVRGYLRGNVGVKHVLGLLSVDTIELK